MVGRRVLILGGTGEAAALARRLDGMPGLQVTSSLAGRTTRPAALPGTVRVGGFGGADGLAVYLRREDIDALVDATHPFAARMKANAASAAAVTGVPLVHLLRPAWTRVPGDDWHEVADVSAAAREVRDAGLVDGAAVFVTVGRQELAPFAGLTGLRLIVRSIEPPDADALPPGATVLTAAGPFDEAAERTLMLAHGVRMLVSKNSGGGATYAKIAAARGLGLPVVMVRRPPPPAGEIVDTVSGVLGWLARSSPV